MIFGCDTAAPVSSEVLTIYNLPLQIKELSGGLTTLGLTACQPSSWSLFEMIQQGEVPTGSLSKGTQAGVSCNSKKALGKFDNAGCGVWLDKF